MLQGLFILIALITLWFSQKHRPEPAPPSFDAKGQTLADLIAVIAIVIGELEILPLMKVLSAHREFLPGDASTHALVSMHLFDSGLLPSWSDRYVGGFPLAMHYPITGWATVGLLTQLGFSAWTATLVVGYAATLCLPHLVYWISRRNGANVIPSLIAACFWLWLSPLSSFVGGYETFFVTGLLSQAIALPFLILWAESVLARGNIVRAMVLANITVISHPQLAAAGIFLVGLCVAITTDWQKIRRYLVSVTSMGVVGGLIWGRGTATMELPFGWPGLPPWMRFGFGPDRLDDWFVDGDLLDLDRPPILTGAWLSCLLLLAFRARSSRAARAAIVGSLGSILLCVSGPLLAKTGPLGNGLLRGLQPLRAIACVPFVAAVTVLIALESFRGTFSGFLEAYAARMRQATLRAWFTRYSAKLFSGLGLLCCLPLGLTLRDSRRFHVALWVAEFEGYPRHLPCGPNGPTGSEVAALNRRLATLQGGRLWFDPTPTGITSLCGITTGFERFSSVPIAPSNGAGAQVGLLHEANIYLDPEAPGLAQRAQALGIRYVLMGRALAPEVAQDWEQLDRFGPLFLYRRTVGSDYFGFACITGEWRGTSLDLQEQFSQRLKQAGVRNGLLDPSRVSWIHFANEPATYRAWDVTCPNLSGATLEELPRPSGSYAARAAVTHPTELLLRASAHPTWHITVNGKPSAPHLVTPGYYAIHLEPGLSAIEATNRVDRFVATGFAFAFLLPGLGLFITRRAKAVAVRG